MANEDQDPDFETFRSHGFAAMGYYTANTATGTAPYVSMMGKGIDSET